MAPNTLRSMADAVMRKGPHRVVIASSGDATSSRMARAQHNIRPDIVFLRQDGWTLGAPKEFERVAYSMWKNEWVGFMCRPNDTARPIREYDSA